MPNADCGCACPPGFSGPTCAIPAATTAQGLAFDGSSDYVEVSSAYAPYLSGSQATLEAWVKRNSGTYYTIFQKQYKWGLGINPTGELEWTNNYPNSGEKPTSYSATVPVGVWTHVAIVQDGTTYRFYINGALVGTKTGGGTLSDSQNSSNLYIGYSLNGSLDEVRIWNVARSEAEIQSAMNTELTGTETGLKTYYKFNETSGTTLSDAVGCASGALQYFSSGILNWATGATVNSVMTVTSVPELAVYGLLGNETSNYSSLRVGVQMVNTTADYTITLSNIGGGTLDISGFYFDTDVSPSYTLVSGPAVTSLAAGQSTTVTIRLNTNTGVTTYQQASFFSFSTNDCDESYVEYYPIAHVTNSTVDSHRGNMLHLDGTGDFVQYTDPWSLDFGYNDAFCGEAWVKTSNTTAGTMQIFSKRTSTDGWGFSLESGVPTLSFANSGSIMTFTGGTGSVTDGHWHHLAFCDDHTTVSMYVDGYPVTVNSTGSAYSNTSSGIDFCIGASNPGSPAGFFDGDIEEVRVWYNTRHQIEIREKMHITLTGNESNLVSYFQFNEAIGTINDPITANNGSLQGNALRIPSTLSVAAGFTSQQVMNGPGSYIFGTVAIVFTAMSAPLSDEVFFVSQLDDFPLNNVSGLPGTALSHWVIRQTGTQTFSYNAIETRLPVGTVISATDAATPSNFKLYKRETNSAGGWTEIGYGIWANIANRTVMFTISPALTSFSEFVVGSSGTTFPVEWLSFEGERTASGHALLTWATASEHNNAGFNVEYSLDGSSFVELGFVAGAGTSELSLSYRYQAPVQEAAYFRLKQTDINGSASYSETRYVAADQATVWYFVPNPVRGKVSLHGALPADSYVRTTIHGADGRLLLAYTGMAAEAAVNEALSGFAPGLYLFQLQVDGNKVVNQQMVIE